MDYSHCKFHQSSNLDHQLVCHTCRPTMVMPHCNEHEYMWIVMKVNIWGSLVLELCKALVWGPSFADQSIHLGPTMDQHCNESGHELF